MSTVQPRAIGPITLAPTPPAPSAHEGMGAIAIRGGTAFRVWAPHAEAVRVTGTFNDWSEEAAPMSAEDDGYWYADVAEAKPGGSG